MSDSESRPPTGRILLVDDEEQILKLLREILEPEGYDLAAARDGAEALSMVLEAEFDLIITDFRMPRMSGKELFDRARAQRPGIEKRFLFISGEMDPEAKTEFIRESGVKVLAKPFKADRVRVSVREALAENGR